MVMVLSQTHVIGAGDTEIVALNCTPHLRAGEILTGTPTATEVGTTDLSISQVGINTTTYFCDETKKTVASSKAVEFYVSGAQAGTTYTILIEVSTTKGRTFARYATLVCE